MVKFILIKTFVTAMGKSDVCLIQNGRDTMGPKYTKPGDMGTQSKTWLGGQHELQQNEFGPVITN